MTMLHARPRALAVPTVAVAEPKRTDGTVRALLPYMLAVIAVSYVTAMRLAGFGWFEHNPALLYLAAISFATWRGGKGSGALATALSAIAIVHG